MDNKYIASIWYTTCIFTLVQGDVPGTYYWRPRLGIDLAIPTTNPAMTMVGPNFKAPSEQGIRQGYIVLIDAYGAGIILIALAAGISSASYMDTLNPLAAPFYTNAYRWFLRYFSRVPQWAAGNQGRHFALTSEVWPQRFSYMDNFMPEWLTKALFFVPEKEWKKEREEFRKFKKYAESTFAKSYRYPSKVFNDWRSEDDGDSSKGSPEISQSYSQGVFHF